MKGSKNLRPARYLNNRRLNGLRLVSAGVMILLALYLLLPAAPAEAAINQIMVTNVTDVSFNVQLDHDYCEHRQCGALGLELRQPDQYC